MLRFDRKQNSVKQLSFNKKIKRKKKLYFELRVSFFGHIMLVACRILVRQPSPTAVEVWNYNH